MFPATAINDPAKLAQSLMDWWSLAGFDVAVDDSPRSWLAPKPAISPTEAPAPVAHTPASHAQPAAMPVSGQPVAVPVAPMPGTIESFMDWLATSPQPEASWSSANIAPHLVPDAPLMVIRDMPGEGGGNSLFSGEEEALLHAMIRALGINAEQVAMASLLLARPAGGVIDDNVVPKLVDRIQHSIDIARPQRLLLMGDRTSGAICPMDGAGHRENLPFVNHHNVTVPTMHVPAPSILLRHPARKAAAWAELRMMAVS